MRKAGTGYVLTAGNKLQNARPANYGAQPVTPTSSGLGLRADVSHSISEAVFGRVFRDHCGRGIFSQDAEVLSQFARAIFGTNFPITSYVMCDDNEGISVRGAVILWRVGTTG